MTVSTKCNVFRKKLCFSCTNQHTMFICTKIEKCFQERYFWYDEWALKMKIEGKSIFLGGGAFASFVVSHALVLTLFFMYFIAWDDISLVVWFQELGGNAWWFDRFLAQHIAIFYYIMTVLMYAISPRMACKY